MIERIITLEGIDPVGFYGAGNVHLQMLKRLHSKLRIVARDNVIKDIGLKKPYIGISPLTSGEIADDFTNYFVNSEQTNSAVVLGVLVDKNGVKSAGGYIITPMPDATDEDISNLDGSYFVWIPRFAYKMNENSYHNNKAGIFEIKFLKDYFCK